MAQGIATYQDKRSLHPSLGTSSNINLWALQSDRTNVVNLMQGSDHRLPGTA